MKSEKSIAKKKILKELVESNLSSNQSSKSKIKRNKAKAPRYSVVTDTLNIESYLTAFFLILLALYFLFNTSLFENNKGQDQFQWREPAGILESRDQRQFTVNDLFRFGVATIVIDPGHGGKDPGTVSSSGLKEKDIVLQVGLELRNILLRETPFNVVMTRDRDETLSLSRRAAIANAAMGDLFVSIHLNYSSYSWFSGIETYILGLTDDTEALRTASLENMAENITVSEMNNILEKIKKDFILHESSNFANSLQLNLVEKLRTYNTRLKNIGVKKAPFVVLAKVDMPGVLIEVAFLSSSRDEALLKDPEYLKSIAGGIYLGIIDYLEGEY